MTTHSKLKYFFGITFVLFHILSSFAQQEHYTTDKSLFDRFSNFGEGNDSFNLYLNMQSDVSAKLNSQGLEQTSFQFKQLRIEAKGEINDWLSYHWRQRLNNSNDQTLTIDNLPTSIDVAGIGLQLSPKWQLFLGRQCAAFGGFEFDLNPIEVYEFSDMNEYITCFLTGIKLAYSPNEKHEWQLQILNGKNNRFEHTYNHPDITPAKAPFLYSLNWNSQLFDKQLLTRWSASVTQQATNKQMYFFAMGNQYVWKNKSSFFLDLMYSREDLDSRGIVTNLTTPNQTALAVHYLSGVAKLNWRIHPQWNVMVQGMYETAGKYHQTEMFDKGKYRTSLGYMLGVEHYPSVNSNLHLFATYIGRSYKHTPLAHADNYNTNRLSAGFVYQLPMF